MLLGGYFNIKGTENIGIMIMGVANLSYHKELSDYYINLYKETNPTFIRILTPLVGLAFFLGGLIPLAQKLIQYVF